jgi:dienelactone hydrolase
MSAVPTLSPLLTGAAGDAVTTSTAWAERREQLRQQWQRCIGPFPTVKAPLKTEILETEALRDFTRQLVRYQIEEGVTTLAYLLTPCGTAETSGKRPAIVVFHQTTRTNFRQAAGLDATIPELMHGLQLVRRGYIVLCPQCFIFEDGAVEAVGFARNTARMQARHPDWTGMARMTWDAMRAADFLEALPGVNRERIGAIGHSLGAKETLYAAAFDSRYRAAVYNDGGIGLNFNNWKAVWYLGAQIAAPGFAPEHHEVLALVAPRAFLFLAGEAEDGERSRPFIDAVQPVYALLGAGENLGWLNHRAGHRYPPEAQAAAEAFLDAHLRG